MGKIRFTHGTRGAYSCSHHDDADMSGEYYRAAEVDAIAADIIALQAENAKLRSERVAEEVGVLHKRIAELEAENKELRRDAFGSEDELASVFKRALHAEQSVAELEKHIAELDTQLRCANAICAATARALDTTERRGWKSEALQEELEAAKKRIAELEEIERAHIKLSGQQDKRIIELEDENMAMEKRIAALCAQIGEMVAELMRLREIVADVDVESIDRLMGGGAECTDKS